MRHSLLVPIAVLLPFLGACDLTFETDRGERISSEAVDEGDVVYVVASRDEEVELGLTEDQVFLRLSERLREEIDAEIREDTEGKNGLGARIVSAVATGVNKALSFRVAWDVDDIHDIRWEDGAVRIELEDSYADLKSVEIDGEEVAEKFSRESIERFSEEFDKVKRGR